MLKKRFIFFYVVGMLVYFFLFSQSLENEYYLYYEKITNLASQELPLQQEGGDKAFKLGSYFGHLTKELNLAHLIKTPNKVAFNDKTYLFYNSTSIDHPVYDNAGLQVSTITNEGMPFVLDKTLYMVNNQSGLIESYTTAGKLQWSYDAGGFITSIDFTDNTLVVGLLDGFVLFLNTQGQFESEYRVSGSRVDVIYGVGLSKSGRYAAIISGLDEQRFILLERGVYGYSPIYSVNLERSLKRGVKLGFSGNEEFVSYEEDGLFFTYSIKTGQSFFTPFEGTLKELHQDIDKNFFAILSRLGDTYYLKILSYKGYYPLWIHQYEATYSGLTTITPNNVVVGVDGLLMQWKRGRGEGDKTNFFSRLWQGKRS